MKKVTLILLLLTTLLSAQISITKTSPAKATKKKAVTMAYDSTYNYPGVRIEYLIGQKLFVLPKPEDMRKFGYKKFIINPNKSEFAPPNIYKHSLGISSGYNALANRYFLLKDVIKTKRKKTILFLLDTRDSDSVYFIYNAYSKLSFPFLIEGYFKKMEKDKLNKKYILRKLAKPIVYITQGFVAKAGAEKLWKIDKVTLDDKLFTISYILKDDANNQILVNKEDFEKTALSEANYKLVKEKYPEKYQMILDENVISGMTKEACKYALGNPDKINYSGNLEQWVYKNLSLYFKNGLLSTYKYK